MLFKIAYAVLRRHAGRIRHEPTDRAWFTALAQLIPRRRWAEVFPVTPATLLAPLTYLEIVGATAVGYVAFGEFPDALTWLGAAVIVASGLTVSLGGSATRE